MCQRATSTCENSCGCTALDMPEWREMTEQIQLRAKQPSQMACFPEDLKCWGAWDTTCGHKAKNITRLRQGRAHMGFSERIDTISNWIELCWTQQSSGSITKTYFKHSDYLLSECGLCLPHLNLTALLFVFRLYLSRRRLCFAVRL